MTLESSLYAITANRQRQATDQTQARRRLNRAALLTACGELTATALQPVPEKIDPDECSRTAWDGLHLAVEVCDRFGWIDAAAAVAENGPPEFAWVVDLLRAVNGGSSSIDAIRTAETVLSPPRATLALWDVLEARESIGRVVVSDGDATEIRAAAERVEAMLAKTREIWPLPPMPEVKPKAPAAALPIQAASPASTTRDKTRKMTANEKMAAVLASHPEAREWTIQQWSVHIRRSGSTICETTIWKGLQATRERMKLELQPDKRHNRRTVESHFDRRG